jgi:hypothetical protein
MELDMEPEGADFTGLLLEKIFLMGLSIFKFKLTTKLLTTAFISIFQ